MANLDPKDLPFLLNEEKGIDWQMLREKFTGRSGLFFNNTNFGGRRGSRHSNGWDIPNLVIDPSVKYRAFGGSEFAVDIIDNNRISGGYNVGTGVPAGVFFNQGVPLWSYASTLNERFLVATLGENWGDRRGNAPESRPALPDDWIEGGTRLRASKGDFKPGAIEVSSVTLPQHNLTNNEKADLVNFSKEVHSVRKKYGNLEQAVSNVDSGNHEELSQWDLDEIEKHVKKTNPKLFRQKELEIIDLQREIDELDAKIDASMKDKSPDRSAIDAAYERSDWRKEKSQLLEQIRTVKLTSYIESIKQTMGADRAKEFKALLTPSAKKGLIEHARWIDEVSKFKKLKLSASDTPEQVRSLLSNNVQNPDNAIGSYEVGEYTLGNIFSPIGYIKADSGLIGGSYESALKLLLEEIETPEKAWSDDAKTNPNGLAHHVFHYMPEFLTGFETGLVSGGKVRRENFQNYTVTDTPEYLPLLSKPQQGVNPETAGNKSVSKEGFFDSPLGRYLLGPKGSQLFIGARDNAAFATPELVWKSKEGFGLEPINSDGNRITASQLQWPLIGKEGAMYSETLPISTYRAPWDNVVTGSMNQWSLHDIPDVQADSDISLLQSLGGYGREPERLKVIGQYHAVPYTVGDFSPSDGNPAVKLANGDIVKKIWHPERIVQDYRGSSDPGLLKLLDSLPPEKLKKPFWVKFDNESSNRTSTPRTFQLNAGEIDLTNSARPTVLFRVDPSQPGGFVVVKEWNNEANQLGVKPIPIDQQTPEMQRNALIRFAQETIDPLSKRTVDVIKQELIDSNLFDYLMPEDIPGRIDSEARSEFSQIQSKFPWLINYISPEQWADSVMAGNKYDLSAILYRTSGTSRTPTPDLASSTTKGYTTIQNLIDESTRGNPNYGKLGSNFGPQLERYFDDKMFQAGRDFKTTSDNIKMAQSKYANDAVFRGNVNRYIGERVPRVAVGALAGVQVKGHLDAGENIFQAVGNTAVEFAAGIAKFNLYERFVGSIETMGDATIEGHLRRQKEALEIDRQWGEYLRGQDWTRWERDEKGNMIAPKIKPEIVKAMGEAHEKKKKEDAAKKATEQWNKENPVWVDGELNQGVL